MSIHGDIFHQSKWNYTMRPNWKMRRRVSPEAKCDGKRTHGEGRQGEADLCRSSPWQDFASGRFKQYQCRLIGYVCYLQGSSSTGVSAAPCAGLYATSFMTALLRML